MDKPTGSPAVGAKEKIEKQARQLAYDVRYKVKQAMSAKSGGGADPAAVKKMYASQLAKSPAAPAVKARAKQMLLGEDLVDPRRLAVESVSSAMYKVFVAKEEVVEEEITDDTYLEQLKESEEKTYKVRVTDKKTGKSYVRMATRAKIAELRANSNIASVEMTGYGEPSKSEKSKGASTAKAKAGKGLDPVGQEDKDIDNDGDHDKSDKYLLKRRKAVGKAIATRKEDFNWQDGFAELIEKKEKEESEKKITGEGVDNSKLVTVFPDSDKNIKEAAEEEASKASKARKKQQVAAQKKVLMAKLQQLQKGEPLVGEEVEVVDEKMNLAKADMGDVVKDFQKSDAPQFKGKSKKKRQQMAIAAKLTAERGGRKLGEEKEGCGCGKTPCECDDREMPTKATLLKNKMRARGIKVAGETPSPRNMKTYDEIGEQVTSTSVEDAELDGVQLQEKPGDGYLGPTPIPNPIRLATDAVDATNRASQRKVNAVNSVLPGSASMPKHTYFNKGPSAASQRYLGLQNSFEPEGEQIDEFWGPKTVTPKNSPSGTKSVEVGKKYPALQNGQMANVTYDRQGNKSVKPMTGIERGVAGLSLRNRGHSSMSPEMKQFQSYEPEGEVIDERRKEEKVAGTPRNDIGKTDLAYRAVKKTIRDMSGGRPAGQRKKEPGKKPPVAGQYGAPKSPAQKVAMIRAARKRSQDNMSSRYD